jgi:RimJ/RimL family protein N-acetyltransferase
MNDGVQRSLAAELAVGEDRPVRPLTAPDRLADEVVTATLMHEGEVADFLRGTQDPDVARFAYARAFDEDTARAYVADVNGTQRERGEAIQFSLRDSDTGEFLGCLLFNLIDWSRQACNVGFWLLPHARGRGVLQRALALGIDWMVSIGMERFGATTDVDNVVTQRALEKAGFAREGILRGLNPGPDGRRDYVSYGLLSTDIAASSASATRAT